LLPGEMSGEERPGVRLRVEQVDVELDDARRYNW
jgi:hypothetical protein